MPGVCRMYNKTSKTKLAQNHTSINRSINTAYEKKATRTREGDPGRAESPNDFVRALEAAVRRRGTTGNNSSTYVYSKRYSQLTAVLARPNLEGTHARKNEHQVQLVYTRPPVLMTSILTAVLIERQEGPEMKTTWGRELDRLPPA